MSFILRIKGWVKKIDDWFFAEEEAGTYKIAFYSFMIGVPAFYFFIKSIQLFII